MGEARNMGLMNQAYSRGTTWDDAPNNLLRINPSLFHCLDHVVPIESIPEGVKVTGIPIYSDRASRMPAGYQCAFSGVFSGSIQQNRHGVVCTRLGILRSLPIPRLL